jgi:serine/threonine protein kinase
MGATKGEFRAGTRLGDYEVISAIRAGGMATLYLARKAFGPNRQLVALKVAHAHLTEDEELMRLFRNEARVQGLVDHPNVVTLYDSDCVGRVHFLVMEYVHGITVAELSKAARKGRVRLAPAVAVWLVAKVAMGLHAAHQVRDVDGRRLHVVHRDVSPHNIMLSFTGDVKLGDFGVVKSDDVHTRGTLKGKFAYMAPEQARGEPLDRRADLFALGTVVWELLAGRRRYVGQNEFEVLNEVSRAEPRPLRDVVNGVSTALDEVVARATARERRHRYASARELRTALLAACPSAVRCRPAHLAGLLADLDEWYDDDVLTLPAPDETEDRSVVVNKRRTVSGERRTLADSDHARPSRPPPRGVAEARSARGRDRGHRSLLPLFAETARDARPLLEPARHALRDRLATMAVLGPKLTPDLYDDADAVLAYQLNAFVCMARFEASSDARSLHQRLAAPHVIDGTPTSLIAFAQTLGQDGDVRIYATLARSLRVGDLGHAFVAESVQAQLDAALARLIDDPDWLRVDHASQRLHLPASAWPFRECFAALAEQPDRQTMLDGLVAVASRRRADLERARSKGYRVVFGQLPPTSG